MRFVLLLAFALCVAAYDCHNEVVSGDKVIFLGNTLRVTNCTFSNVTLYCVDCEEIEVLNSTFVGAALGGTAIGACSNQSVKPNIRIESNVFVNERQQAAIYLGMPWDGECHLGTLIDGEQAQIFLDIANPGTPVIEGNNFIYPSSS